MHSLKQIVAAFACVMAACGGSASDLEPGAGHSAGTGTSTLQVSGEIDARSDIANASTASEFQTHLSVRVRLDGQSVTTGTVTVSTRNASASLVYRAESDDWDGTLAGYDEVFVLDVDSGEHYVEGVRVDGPDLHAFTDPLAGATLDSTTTNRVAWSRSQEAEMAAIDAEEIDRVTIADNGEYMLPAGALKADRETPRTNRIELVRANRVAPAGAVAGSNVTVSVENFIEVIAEADPSL